MISNVLFALAAVLFVYVAYSYIQDRRDDDNQDPRPPPSVAGHAILENVRAAIAAQGVEVEYGRDSVRIEGLQQPPGQQLLVEGAPVYIFLFPDPATRAEETEGLTAENVVLVNSAGDPAADGPFQLAAASNVFAVSDGVDEELQGTISAGIESIP